MQVEYFCDRMLVLVGEKKLSTYALFSVMIYIQWTELKWECRIFCLGACDVNIIMGGIIHYVSEIYQYLLMGEIWLKNNFKKGLEEKESRMSRKSHTASRKPGANGSLLVIDLHECNVNLSLSGFVFRRSHLKRIPKVEPGPCGNNHASEILHRKILIYLVINGAQIGGYIWDFNSFMGIEIVP